MQENALKCAKWIQHTVAQNILLIKAAGTEKNTGLAITIPLSVLSGTIGS